jgi:hypothetical protein
MTRQPSFIDHLIDAVPQKVAGGFQSAFCSPSSRSNHSRSVILTALGIYT